MDGVDAAAAILRRGRPACRVVMLTTFDDEEYVVAARCGPVRRATCSRTCRAADLAGGGAAGPRRAWRSSTPGRRAACAAATGPRGAPAPRADR